MIKKGRNKGQQNQAGRLADKEARLTVRVPADLYAHLVKFAKAEDRTVSQTIRYMIRAYVENRRNFPKG